jgi:hypothetical protein
MTFIVCNISHRKWHNMFSVTCVRFSYVLEYYVIFKRLLCHSKLNLHVRREFRFQIQQKEYFIQLTRRLQKWLSQRREKIVFFFVILFFTDSYIFIHINQYEKTNITSLWEFRRKWEKEKISFGNLKMTNINSF